MRPMTRFAAAAAFLALTAAPLAHGASQCYYPSGSKSNDVPCDPDAEVSMCCGSRDACLSSGLCRIDGTGANVGISYARGTCTDQTWGSPICPQRCRRNQDSVTNPSAYNFGTGGVQVWECVGEGYANPGAYCCESASEKTACCRTQSAVFSLPGASIGNALAVQTFPLPATATSTVRTETSGTETSTSPKATSASSGETSKTDTASTSRTTSESGTGTAPGTSGGPSPTTAQSQGETGGPSPAGSGGLSDAGKIGMGVGIGIGAVLLVAGAGFAWYWMRRRRAAARAASGTAELPGGHIYSGVNKAELYGNEMAVGEAPKELGGRSIAELGSYTEVAEMYAGPQESHHHRR